jgi:hypothetical protein
MVGEGGADGPGPGPGVPDAPPGACPAPPASASATTLDAYARMNAARLLAGAGCATLVPALDTASAKHCAYYSANASNKACTGNAHLEVSGCPMFVAADFGQRDRLAGYTGSPVFETMAFGPGGGGAVQVWIDSIWHRSPVLSPWVRDVGYGDAAGCATMDFGAGAGGPAGAVVTWPADGQTGVPTSFDGRSEGPTPPAPPAGWPSGYPITIWIKGELTAHTLTRDGDATNIAHRFIGPEDALAMGLLADDYVLYADAPLAAATRYRVRASGAAGTVDFTFITR